MKKSSFLFFIISLLASYNIWGAEEAQSLQKRPSKEPVDFVRDVMQPMGMPMVSSFHAVRESLFLNTHVKRAHGLEALGDFFLAPSRYLFAGKTVQINEGEVTAQQSFRYQRLHWLKTTLAIAVLPVTEVLGMTFKGLSYLSPKVRKKHRLLKAARTSPPTHSMQAYYQSLGIPSFHSEEAIPCLHYQRPSSLKKKQEIDIKAFKEIAQIFDQHGIIYWIDFGTCLGAYRYGGIIPWDWDIDISVLLPDHENVKRALSQLDPKKYQIQDWSSYSHPGTFIKVFVKESNNLIDIMHYRIDPTKKEIAYFFTYEHSPFPESWKRHELEGMKPLSFDTVFPLKKAQFDGLTVWAPNDVVTYLESKYEGNLAPSNIWDEEQGCYIKVKDHPFWNPSQPKN